LDLKMTNQAQQNYFISIPMNDSRIPGSGMRELSDNERLLVSGGLGPSFWNLLYGASQGAVFGGASTFSAALYTTGSLSAASQAGIAGMIGGGVTGGLQAGLGGR
jgi:hypothetical protein